MLAHLAAVLVASTLSPAHALTPPAGWTSTGPYRAVRDPNNPAMGEVREFNVSGGTGNTAELAMMLRAAGAEATTLNADGAGAVGIMLSDSRLGRARYKSVEGGVTWMVVMAAANIATTMDPDAIITAAFTPKPAVAGWGGQTATPMAPGNDGAPWGGGAAATAAATGPGWQPTGGPPAAWTQSPEVVGKWSGTAFIKFAPTTLTFDFKSDGTVSIERKANGRVELVSGTWATLDGNMRLQAPGGGESLPYTLSGGAMSFPFEGTRVSIKKQ